jgi:rhamnulokinase
MQSGKAIEFIAARAAERAPVLRSLIDPDDDLFLRPGDLPARIAEFCARTQQTIPQTRGEIVRCVLESLALKYRFQLERLENMLGKKFEQIQMFGGGCDE